MSKIRSPKKWRGSKSEHYVPRSSKGSQKFSKKNKIHLFNGSKIKKAIKLLVAFFVLCAIVGSIVLISLIAYFSKDLPDPNKLIARSVAQSTKIFDRTGEHLLYEIHGDEKRTIVALDDIPEHAIWAVIALEDKNFYNKKFGLSFNRTVLAVFFYGWSKVTGRPFKLGGSGITQQLVKNAILTPEKTVSRKVKEWILTVQIERKFSKDEILQMYFNEIPYGSTAYGIESASNFYFGKSAKDLEMYESATLAAIIQRPTYYSPYGNHRDELLARKDVVLSLMERQGYINEDEKEEAQKGKIEFKKKYEKIEAPHFVFFVREFLTGYYGEQIVEQGGLKVITTLDYDLQKMAELAVAKNIENIEKFDGTNAALVSMDPSSGDILAMVGSRDYFDIDNDGNVNVTIRPRQPGSSFKPIVYAAAFAKGYTPETIMYDVETTFKTVQDDYIPHNYDLEERGPMTIREALQGSLNIPAVKTIYLTGVDSVLDLADHLGYSTLKDRSRFGLSLVLGGGEVTLLEHLTAYSTFAQEGLMHAYRSILEIQDSDGKVVDKFPIKKKRVLDKKVARTLNNVLSDNEARSYVFGLHSNLTVPGYEIAAKTGTTNDYRDAWTIGYTPDLVAGAWVGNNNNDKMKRGASGGKVAAPIWNEFMKQAIPHVLDDQEPDTFNEPPENKSEKKILIGELEDVQIIKIDSISGKLATELTPEDVIERKVFRIHHSILHYLYKDEPDGPAPEDPEKADSAYTLWEEGIQKWIEKKQQEEDPEGEEGEESEEPKKEEDLEPEKEIICRGATEQDTGFEIGEEICETVDVVFMLPPQEYDDVHTPENQPTIDISFPKDNMTVSQQEILFTVDVFSARGVSYVEYYINDELIGNVDQSPFSLLFNMSNYDNGFHTLKAIVFDDVKNRTEKIINFNFLQQKQKLAVTWMGPKMGNTIKESSFPVTLNLFSSRYSEIKKIDIFGQKIQGDRFFIGTIITPEKNTMTLDWKQIAQSGDIILSGQIEMIDGAMMSLPSINVNITNE